MLFQSRGGGGGETSGDMLLQIKRSGYMFLQSRDLETYSYKQGTVSPDYLWYTFDPEFLMVQSEI